MTEAREADTSLQLDHIAFGVADVDAIRAALIRLGFKPTSSGVCRWTLAGRAHEAPAASVVFARGYLDLIEIREPGWERHLHSSALFGRGIAPTGLVLSTPSLTASRDALTAAGIATAEPYAIRRELAGAEPPQIDYRIFSLREPGLPFAVIEDAAPQALRRPQWLSHPNGAVAVRHVHLRVPSLEAWRAAAAKIAGAGLDNGCELPLGAAVIVAHEEPGDPYLAAVARLLPLSRRAAVLALEIAVHDLNVTRSLLQRNGIATVDVPGGVAVAPDAGYGCGLVLAEVAIA